MRGLASGAMTVTWASAARSDSILDSARWPAPMTMQGRAVSLRKMGKRDMLVALRGYPTPPRYLKSQSLRKGRVRSGLRCVWTG